MNSKYYNLLANFIASSKCLFVISGTGSSSSSTSMLAPCSQYNLEKLPENLMRHADKTNIFI